MIWQLLAFAIAVAVMASPDVLDLGDPVADAFHVLAPIDAAVAAMAASPVLRNLRRVHLVLGPMIALAGLLLGGGPPAAAVGLLGGTPLALLALPGAPRPGRYGGGWKALVQADGAAQHAGR
ncbi:MAG TPA: hypothetical protein VFH63_11090 [candidate division Zixibacteria bacterium]|nr:hypothetical protein [candidate division Zixibacteria bacterium]